MEKRDLHEWWNTERIAAEDDVWLRQRRFVQYAQRVIAVMDKYNLKSVLELGCGMGYVGNELHNKGFEYTGTDGSKLMIDLARKRHPDLNFHVANIRNLDEYGADLVCSFAVLKHFSVNDWPKALRCMLACSWTALIQVQTVTVPTYADDTYPDVNHIWINDEKLQSEVNHAGFKVLDQLDRVSVSSHASTGVEYLLLAVAKGKVGYKGKAK